MSSTPRVGSPSSWMPGTLPIQGPPGTGKTYAGARMILDLVGAGKRVGVTAQSHKTISNLLEAVVEAASEERVVVRILQKADADDSATSRASAAPASNADVAAALSAGTVDVVAGTGWLFARQSSMAPSTSCSSTRPARCRWPTPWRSARARARSC